MGYKNCLNCQGDRISDICVDLTDSKFDTLYEFVEDTTTKLDELTKDHEIELKELAPSPKKYKRDEIIQILIDEVIRLRGIVSQVKLSESCTLDWDPIKNCNSCDKSDCDNMQTLINIVGELKDQSDL